MSPISPAIINLSRWLLAHEAATCKSSKATPQVFMCVCEKLRIPLSTLAGVEGYKALISRALTLAKKEAPSLDRAHIGEEGSLEWPGAAGPERDMDESADGGAALVAQLLGLLVIFIGEALTLRLVRDVWPDAFFDGAGSETEREK